MRCNFFSPYTVGQDIDHHPKYVHTVAMARYNRICSICGCAILYPGRHIQNKHHLQHNTEAYTKALAHSIRLGPIVTSSKNERKSRDDASKPNSQGGNQRVDPDRSEHSSFPGVGKKNYSPNVVARIINPSTLLEDEMSELRTMYTGILSGNIRLTRLEFKLLKPFAQSIRDGKFHPRLTRLLRSIAKKSDD